MKNLKYYQSICILFPPILSQSIRNFLFPITKARNLKLDFSKKSITGSVFHGNTLDDHSYRFAIHGFFDWRNIIIANRCIKESLGDIVEVGANVGTETISYCDLVASKAKVHAFEPLPDNIIALTELSEQLNNLIVYPKAISNKVATVHFQLPPIHESGIGKIIKNEPVQDGTDSLMVETLPLDFYIEDFKNVCLISVDTEGHEPLVLEGAYNVISRFRPAVIIEVSPKLLRKYSNSKPQDILQYFIELDYSCFIIGRATLRGVDKFCLDTKKAQNWLCIPSEKADISKKINNDLFIRAFVPWYFLKSIITSTKN